MFSGDASSLSYPRPGSSGGRVFTTSISVFSFQRGYGLHAGMFPGGKKGGGLRNAQETERLCCFILMKQEKDCVMWEKLKNTGTLIVFECIRIFLTHERAAMGVLSIFVGCSVVRKWLNGNLLILNVFEIRVRISRL